MKIREVLERLKNGENMRSIASGSKYSVSAFQRNLRKHGYEWDNSNKYWYYAEEGEEPIDDELFGSRKKVHTGVHTGVHMEHIRERERKLWGEQEGEQECETGCELKGELGCEQIFTEEEISFLKAFAKKNLGEMPCELEGETNTLSLRIAKLEQGEKQRKTVVISEGVGKKLDAFCKKKGVFKSDVMEAALIDFMDQYDATD